MKVSANIYLLVVWSTLLSSPSASALESKTASWQDRPARMWPAKGGIRLAQIHHNEESTVIGKSSGQLGTPFHLTILAKPNTAFQWRTLLLKKLPSTCTFSPGIRIDDTHYISISDIANITITVSKGAPAEVMLSAVLLDDDRMKEVHELKVKVAGNDVTVFETDEKGTDSSASVAAPSPRSTPISSAASTEPSTGPTSVVGPARLDSGLEKTYLQRAENLLKLGQIAPARLLLEHLANKGSARGALLLGETYDEFYLKALNVVGGVSAESDKALRWYRKAGEFGAAEASAHIQRLNGR